MRLKFNTRKSCKPYSKLFQISPTAVLKWIRTFAEKQAPKPTHSPRAFVILELDEMWHSVENKRNKRWIGKVVDRKTGHLLAWECGSRDRATLEKLSVRHYALNVGIYYAAKWEPVCESLFPASKWVQTRAEMPRNERNNSRMRHGFGRFKGKSTIVSIVKLIIIYTLAEWGVAYPVSEGSAPARRTNVHRFSDFTINAWKG